MLAREDPIHAQDDDRPAAPGAGEGGAVAPRPRSPLGRGRWPGLESALIPPAVALMWVAWLAPLVFYLLNSGLAYPAGTPFPGWLLYALLLGASALRHALAGRSWGRPLVTVVGLAVIVGVGGWLSGADPRHLGRWLAGLGALLARTEEGFPAPLIVFLISALAWLWGLAVTWQDYGELFAGFVLGVLGFGFLLLVPARPFWEAAPLRIVAYLLLFVVSGLVSLGLVSAAQTLAAERRSDAGVPPLRREWLAAVGAVVLGVLLLGWGAARWLSPELPAELWAALRPVGRAVERVLAALLMGVAYVVFGVLGPLIEFLQRLAARNWGALTDLLAGVLAWVRSLSAGGAGRAAPARPGADPRTLLAVARYVILGLLGLVLAAGLWLGARRRARRRRPFARDVRESLLTRELLRAQWSGLLAGLRRRRRPPEPYLPLAGEDARRAIRRLYRGLLARMAAVDRPRAPGLTPRAYARALAPQVPGCGAAVATLTEAYLLARYAPEEPGAEELTAAQSAWEDIERSLAERSRPTKRVRA